MPLDFGVGTHHIYNLRKTGYSTYDAVQYIADTLKCKTQDISYSGLKDEDGITVQYISSTNFWEPEVLAQLNSSNSQIFLQYLGSSHTPCKIGRILGNSFRVKVRNIPHETASKISDGTFYRHSYLNYYGTQRFGLPRKDKTTHLLGKALLDNNFDSAFRYILDQQPDNMSLHGYAADPSEYFKSIDVRKLIFYYNSHLSFEWNKQLIDAVSIIDKYAFHNQSEGIDFLYATDNIMLRQFASDMQSIPLMKYRVIEEEIITIDSSRTSVIDVEIFVDKINRDPLYSGKYELDLAFCLPSGSYATVIIPQFIYIVENL